MAEAQTQFVETLRLNPDEVEAGNNLANIFALDRRWAEAIEQYREVLRARPDFAEAHNNLGGSLFSLGRFADAYAEYKEATRLSPAYTNAFFNLALAAAANNQPQEALRAAERALELARSEDRSSTAEKIETWLNAYRKKVRDPSAAP